MKDEYDPSIANQTTEVHSPKNGTIRMGYRAAAAIPVLKAPSILAAWSFRSARSPDEQFDHVRDQVDVTPFAVLWRPERAARPAPANAHDRLLEIDVAPSERNELSLPHSRLERDQAQRPIGRVVEVTEEARQLVILEVRGLLSLRPGPLRWRQLPDRVRIRIAVEDGGLPACTQHAQVLSAS